jgi:ABC-2 type transport system ATP-binding protein
MEANPVRRGALTLLLLFCLADVAQAAPLDALRCHSDARVKICEGKVPSYDGTLLDTTLTLPVTPAPARGRPLVVFLHGLLADKGEYLSQSTDGTGSYKTAHWNNRWFAARGYAVVNYSARGHGASGGEINLASKNVEVRDARWIAGAIVDARALARVDGERVAVLGSSYGGGQAWLLMTTRPDAGTPYGEWRSPEGRRVRLVALVPQYTWTDLVQSLVPNGRQSSRGVVDPKTANTPLGVAKITLIDGFLASAGSRLPREAYGWLARTTAGEPYEGDPSVDAAKRALSEDRSAYFQDDYFRALASGRARVVPVLAAQGVTDPIFSALEAVRMYRRLRATRPGYPMGMWFGDFEHLTALAKERELRTFHDEGSVFLARVFRRPSRRPPLDVRMAVTDCDPARFGPVLKASSWDGLAKRHVTFDLAGAQPTASAGGGGPQTDPVVLSSTRGRGCITTTDPIAGGWTVPIAQDLTLAGMPRLRFSFTSAAPDLTFTPRLWDVAPDGTKTLVTRGAWRSLAVGGESVDTELFGAAWRFAAGHALLLEIPQSDATYFRPDNFASGAVVSGVRLELPVA